MSQLSEMAELLSQSQLVPLNLRNKADCLAACLKVATDGQLPTAFFQGVSQQAAPAKAQSSIFTRIAVALALSETQANLQEAIRLMDELTKGVRLDGAEERALLIICRDRNRALGGKSTASRPAPGA